MRFPKRQLIGVAAVAWLLAVPLPGWCDDAPWVDVRSFGAKGDGTSDDASAIQKAIDSVPAGGGMVLLGKPGDVFRIGSTIRIDRTIRLKGWGWNENYGVPSPTTIVKDSRVKGSGLLVAGSRTILEDFVLDAESGNGGDGIALDGNGITVRNVSVYRQGRDGVRVGRDDGGNSNSWAMTGVSAKNNGRHGFHFHSGSGNANAGVGTVLEASNNGGDGFFLGMAVANTFVGSLAETNKGFGLRLGKDSSKNVFVGGDLDEANTAGDLMFERGSGKNVLLYVSVSVGRIVDRSDGRAVYRANDHEAGASASDVVAHRLTISRSSNMAIQDGANHNVALPASSFSRITSPGGEWTITGIEAPEAGGQWLVLANGTGHAGRIEFDDAHSSEKNRILASGGDNVIVRNLGAVELIYDDGASRWRVLQP